MARKKIKLEEEAISEILVADIDSESGAEARNVEDDFQEEEEEEEEEEPQQKLNYRLQKVMDYQPGDHLKEGTQINILLLVRQKGVKKSEAPHINKHTSPLPVSV